MFPIPSRVACCCFVSILLACAAPALATVTLSRSTDPAYPGDDDFLFVQADQSFSYVTWQASGPAGPLDLSDYNGAGFAILPYDRAGVYTVTATVTLNQGGTESGSLSVTIPKPVALVSTRQPGGSEPHQELYTGTLDPERPHLVLDGEHR